MICRVSLFLDRHIFQSYDTPLTKNNCYRKAKYNNDGRRPVFLDWYIMYNKLLERLIGLALT